MQPHHQVIVVVVVAAVAPRATALGQVPLDPLVAVIVPLAPLQASPIHPRHVLLLASEPRREWRAACAEQWSLQLVLDH